MNEGEFDFHSSYQFSIEASTASSIHALPKPPRQHYPHKQGLALFGENISTSREWKSIAFPNWERLLGEQRI